MRDTKAEEALRQIALGVGPRSAPAGVDLAVSGRVDGAVEGVGEELPGVDAVLFEQAAVQVVVLADVEVLHRTWFAGRRRVGLFRTPELALPLGGKRGFLIFYRDRPAVSSAIGPAFAAHAIVRCPTLTVGWVLFAFDRTIRLETLGNGPLACLSGGKVTGGTYTPRGPTVVCFECEAEKGLSLVCLSVLQTIA